MKEKKKDEGGAPAYMGQYASLMTILLAFFIALLTMTRESLRDMEFSARYILGVGEIRTAFSLDTGIGIMRFIKSLLPLRPEVEEESEDEDRHYLAYRKGTFQHRRFDVEYIDKIETESLKQVVRVLTPIMFPAGSADIRPEDLVFLDRLAGVLRNLPERSITVACYSSAGSDKPARMLAARRAAAITRYLEDQGRVPRRLLLPVGYSDSRYLGDMDAISGEQATLFFISGQPSRMNM